MSVQLRAGSPNIPHLEKSESSVKSNGENNDESNGVSSTNGNANGNSNPNQRMENEKEGKNRTLNIPFEKLKGNKDFEFEKEFVVRNIYTHR
jgi:hypothetical protein